MKESEEECIKELFKKVEIPQIPEEEIKVVCNVTAEYLSKVKRKVSLWDIVWLDLSSISLPFWVVCAALMVGYIIFIGRVQSDLSIMGMFMALSPIPLLFSVIELLWNRTPAVTELEKVCKYNISQLYVVKIMTGIFINFVVLLLISFFTSGRLAGIVKLMLTGSSVMFILGFAALAVARRLGHSLPVIGILAGWVLVSFILFQSENALALLIINAQVVTLVVVFALSIALFTWGLHMFTRRVATLTLGGTNL